MPDALDLYQLLPAHHRREDELRGFPLRGVLKLIHREGDLLRHGFYGFWDDLFIETCDAWVIPYIGELVANNLLHGQDWHGPDPYQELFRDLVGPDLRPTLAVPLRTDVARTVYYRRRKGTLPMLERLAKAVTGWGAKAQEMFELLEWSQNDDHLRFQSPECAEVRYVEPIDRVDGAFDIQPHTADVRRIAQAEGWHGIANVGFFLWRLRSYPLERVPPRPVDPAVAGEWRFHFSPLGQPAPLFTNPRTIREGARVTELDVPGPVRRAFFWDDLVRYRERIDRPRPERTDLYGPLADDASFQVWMGGGPLPPVADPSAEPDAFPALLRVVCRHLDPWPPRPSGNVVAIDPANGRLALGQAFDPGPDARPPLEVSYGYGFSADLGGGPYERRAWLAESRQETRRLTVGADPLAGADRPDLVMALGDWAAASDRRHWVITILDSRTYALPASIALAGGGELVIEAANGQRPLLVTVAGGLGVGAAAPGPGEELTASLTLSGVVVEGHLEVTGDVRRLRLLHTTLVPGRRLAPATGAAATGEPSLVVAGQSAGVAINRRLRVEMAFSIAGPLRLPAEIEGLWVLDGILDGRVAADGAAVRAPSAADAPGPAATLERVTVLGASFFRQLTLASEVIFTEPVEAERRQEGCVRFSYVPRGSVTPRRFRCQPDQAVADAEERAEQAGGTLSPSDAGTIRRRIVPGFADRRYGQPAYCQLSLGTAGEIRTGAEDGSEMGAFSHLQQPQRETNLRIRLDEYLPYGLVPGLIYMT